MQQQVVLSSREPDMPFEVVKPDGRAREAVMIASNCILTKSVREVGKDTVVALHIQSQVAVVTVQIVPTLLAVRHTVMVLEVGLDKRTVQKPPLLAQHTVVDIVFDPSY